MAQVTSEKQLAAKVAGWTVATCFRDTVAARPEAPALRWRDGEAWKSWTWAEYADRACRLAAALSDLGVVRGERVVLMMRNRPEFHVADMATLLVGATPVSIYNSSAPEQIQYLVRHSGAVVAIVEDVDYLERLLKVRDELPCLEHVVVIDDDGRVPEDVLHFETLCGAAPVDLDAAAGIARPDDLATVIYTSGTTGPPKGVMLDHTNIVWTTESMRLAFAPVDPTGSRTVSYLPMAHIAERQMSHYQGIGFGYEVTTCPEPSLLASYLPEARPQIMFAVPRVWEKLHAGVRALAAKDPEQARRARRGPGGRRAGAGLPRAGEAMPRDLAAEHAAHDPTLAFVRQALGLDQLIAAISGAAPLPREVLVFFRSLGVEFSEIYGLSETTGPLTWEPWRVKLGTVGPAIPGATVRLAEDGEVLAAGGNIFGGYLNDPERTADALDTDGWLHTGDIGELDADGYLRIVDRKKELIITAGGKNISPANLEAALKSSPLIGQAAVIGDARPYVSALVVLDPEVAPAWAKAHGVDASLPELANNPTVVAEIEREVAGVNERFNRVEQIKRVRGARRGVAPRLRGADPDDEAEAARHRREVRGRDRGPLPRRRA